TVLTVLGLWVCLEVALRVQMPNNSQSSNLIESVGYGGGGSFVAGLFASMNRNWLHDLIQSFPYAENRLPDGATFPSDTADSHPAAGQDQEYSAVHSDFHLTDSQGHGHGE